ncbi:MAG: DNA topoisomerase IV subunit A, partial [Magnetococcales bacterium]|nr:DNA topoisomerase IV subunit A [Magnetococcales bacterium]
MVSFIIPSGRVYSTLAAHLYSGKGFGDPLTVTFEMDDWDGIAWVMAVYPEQEYFVATRLSRGMRIMGEHLIANTRKGKQVIGINPDDNLLTITPVRGDSVASIDSDGRMLISPLISYPLLPRGKGVRIQRLLRAGSLVDVTVIDTADGVILDSGKRKRHVTDLDPWLSHRASRGVDLPFGFKRGGRFAVASDDGSTS